MTSMFETQKTSTQPFRVLRGHYPPLLRKDVATLRNGAIDIPVVASKKGAPVEVLILRSA